MREVRAVIRRRAARPMAVARSEGRRLWAPPTPPLSTWACVTPRAGSTPDDGRGFAAQAGEGVLRLVELTLTEQRTRCSAAGVRSRLCPGAGPSEPRPAGTARH